MSTMRVMDSEQAGIHMCQLMLPIQPFGLMLCRKNSGVKILMNVWNYLKDLEKNILKKMEQVKNSSKGSAVLISKT